MLVTTKSKNIGYCDVCRKNSFTRHTDLYINRKRDLPLGWVYTDQFGHVCPECTEKIRGMT